MADLSELIGRLGRPRVLVVGDLMLDKYHWGVAERISPEAPVLVLAATDCEVRLGGAASVAGLLTSLGAEVALAGVVGKDHEAETLLRLLDERGVDRRHVIVDASRCTTVKERFLARTDHGQPHQTLRVDREIRKPIDRGLEQRLLEGALDELPSSRSVLISDYGKGVCAPGMLGGLIQAAKDGERPILIDPAKQADYSRYRNASLLTPNRMEAGQTAGIHIASHRDALDAARTIVGRFGVQGVLTTLDKDGAALFWEGEQSCFPTRQRAVCDVTGAGDTMLAALGLCLGCNLPLKPSIEFAISAAGLQVERIGVAPITRDDLRREIATSLLLDSQRKLVSIEEAEQWARALRRERKTLVMTNGCFDLLHAGHLACLEEAARLGDHLLVAVNSDASVHRLKGKGRPIVSESDRSALLAALGCVARVVVQHADSPHELIRRLRPDVLVKGGTYDAEDVVGAELVAEYGGRVVVTHRREGVSTTQLVAACQENKISPRTLKESNRGFSRHTAGV